MRCRKARIGVLREPFEDRAIERRDLLGLDSRGSCAATLSRAVLLDEEIDRGVDAIIDAIGS